MQNIEIIDFLKTAPYYNTIQVIKNKNTTTIVDTVNNVVFSITYLPHYPKKIHCYFTNAENKTWLTMALHRLIISGLDFDKSTLPADWDEDDLLLLTNNVSFFTSQEEVLNKALNYFFNHVDQLQLTKSEIYFNLHKN